MVKDWTAAERQKLRDDVPKRGFKRRRSATATCCTLAQETLRLCARGLARRARLDRNGRDETRYLRPLEEMRRARHHAGRGTAGEYFNDWDGSVEPIFEEYAY